MDAAEANGRDDTPLDPRATDRERAIAAYALELTRRPAGMTERAIAPLRAAGLTDGEILDANQVTAYFAYVNRVADGLGVALEPWTD